MLLVVYNEAQYSSTGVTANYAHRMIRKIIGIDLLCVSSINALPYLKEAKGRIINFGSSSGTHGTAGMLSYGTSKEAIRGMTKILAIELAKYDINVNCVVPTGNSPAWEATKKAYPDRVEKMLEGYLLRRGTDLGDPETDIGGVVVFLASKYSQYMTSRTLFADGGNGKFR